MITEATDGVPGRWRFWCDEHDHAAFQRKLEELGTRKTLECYDQSLMGHSLGT